MDQPLVLVGVGALFGALGGLLTFMAFDTDTPDLMLLAWAVGGLGSLVLFVGLVAVGVAVGVRAARR